MADRDLRSAIEILPVSGNGAIRFFIVSVQDEDGHFDPGSNCVLSRLLCGIFLFAGSFILGSSLF